MNQREKAYRSYISEGIRIITENLAQISGGEYISKKLFDEEVKEVRTGDEIVQDVLNKICRKE